MAARRNLEFNRIEDIMPEVDRLIDGGHTTVGNWSLAQICNHLTSTFIWSVEGYPVMMPWVLRATLGNIIKAKVFKTGKIRDNAPLPKSMVPQPDLDTRAEAEALRAAIGQYLANPLKRAPHPMFGDLGVERADRLSMIHAAHHLSFVVPNAK